MAKCYLLPCKNCGNPLQVEGRHAGRSLDCSKCGETVDVPTFRELKALQVDGGGDSKDTSRDETRPSPLKGLLFSVGLGVAVIFGLGGWGLYAYASQLITNTIFNADDKVERMNEPVDDASVTELYDVWANTIEGVDLPDWQEANWNRYNKQGRILRNFSYGILGVAALGIALIFSSFFIPNTRV